MKWLIAQLKDNTLIEDVNGSKSNGTGEFLFVGRTNEEKLRWAILQFDLTGAISAGSTINCVMLHLNVTAGSRRYRVA